jgi:WD40 repeat protein
MKFRLLKLVRVSFPLIVALLIVSCSASEGADGEPVVHSIPVDEPIYNIQLSANDDLLGISSWNGIRVYRFDGLVELWAVERVADSNSISFSFSHDGTLLAYNVDSSRIVLANAETGEAQGELTSGLAEAGALRGLTFSPDDALLAGIVTLGPALSTTSVWDVQTGEQLHSFIPEEVYSAPEGMHLMFMQADFSPDNRQLATGLFGSRIILWDVETGERGMDLQDLENAFGTIDALDWNPDGVHLVAGHRGGVVSIWDTVNGELLNSFDTGNTYGAYRVKWSPDGNILANTMTGIGEIQLRNSEGDLLDTLLTKGEFVTGIDWSSTDSALVVGDSLGNLYIWQVPY